MQIKKYFDSFFVLSKSERNGAVVLISIIIIVIIFRFLVPLINNNNGKNKEAYDQRIYQLEKIKDSLNRKDYHPPKTTFSASTKVIRYTKSSFIETNKFDPNKVTLEELKQLGFSTFAAKNLMSFRGKGGKIHRSDDLKKIYGIDSLFFAHIQPFVILAEEVQNKKIIIELNGADSSTLTSLKGIGPVYAARICKYRNYLGGFVSIDQLKEVYQFPEETFQSVKDNLTLDETKVEKMNINFADVKELKKHPYCGYNVARKIIDYRSNKGFIQTIDQLLLDSVIEVPIFNRLSPYLKVQ
jgi:competence protein ComEA